MKKFWLVLMISSFALNLFLGWKLVQQSAAIEAGVLYELVQNDAIKDLITVSSHCSLSKSDVRNLLQKKDALMVEAKDSLHKFPLTYQFSKAQKLIAIKQTDN